MRMEKNPVTDLQRCIWNFDRDVAIEENQWSTSFPGKNVLFYSKDFSKYINYYNQVAQLLFPQRSAIKFNSPPYPIKREKKLLL